MYIMSLVIIDIINYILIKLHNLNLRYATINKYTLIYRLILKHKEQFKTFT